MIQIDDVQKHTQRKQQEANATPAPQPVEAVSNPAPVSVPIPSPVPASAVDSGAPAVTPTESLQQKQEVPPVIPSLAVAPGGPTSPMNEKPVVTITDPTDTKLVGSNLPDITTESFEEAMKRGRYTPAEWLHENEKAAKEGRRSPLTTMDYLTVLKYGELNETPEQKAKRERREQISQAISGIGNVIANAANLAFAAKGAVPIDLNSGVRYENERLQRIKEKRDALKEKSDALFLNAKQDEIRYARSLEAAKAKAQEKKDAAELDFQRELILKGIDDAYKKGIIDLQQKYALERDAKKAKSDMDLEAYKQKNRIYLKQTPGAEKKSSKSNKVEKIRVYDKDGKMSLVDADLISERDFWKYAKNALVADGKMRSGDGYEVAYKLLKENNFYGNSEKLKDLKKVANRVIPNNDYGFKPLSVSGSNKSDVMLNDLLD